MSEVDFTLKSHISERSLIFSYVLTSIILRIDQRSGSEISQGRYKPIRGFMSLCRKERFGQTRWQTIRQTGFCHCFVTMLDYCQLIANKRDTAQTRHKAIRSPAHSSNYLYVFYCFSFSTPFLCNVRLLPILIVHSPVSTRLHRAYCTISFNSAPSVTRYQLAEISISAGPRFERDIQIFSAGRV